MGAMGCFLSYLATTMTLRRSPILIPQLSYGIMNYKARTIGQRRTEKGRWFVSLHSNSHRRHPTGHADVTTGY